MTLVKNKVSHTKCLLTHGWEELLSINEGIFFSVLEYRCVERDAFPSKRLNVSESAQLKLQTTPGATCTVSWRSGFKRSPPTRCLNSHNVSVNACKICEEIMTTNAHSAKRPPWAVETFYILPTVFFFSFPWNCLTHVHRHVKVDQGVASCIQ